MEKTPRERLIRDGYDPAGAQQEWSSYLRRHGPDALEQKRTTKEEQDELREPYEFVYISVVEPFGGYRDGLYIKAVVTRSDGAYSLVVIVSAHPSGV